MFVKNLLDKIRGNSADLLAILLVLILISGFAFMVWGTTLFQESFNKASQEWLVGPGKKGNATWKFSNNRYQTLVTRPNSVSTSKIPYEKRLSEYCLKLYLYQFPIARGGEVGIAFGTGDADSELNTFGIYLNGNYRLGKYTGREIKNLPVTTKSYKLGDGSRVTTELKVVKEEDVAKFYGDGKLLATISADQVSICKPMAFFGRAGQEPFVQGVFDNLQILDPSDCS